MSKHLISLNPRADKIVEYVKENNISTSNFANDSFVNNLLPIYSSTLRVEALYLLDIAVDGAKNWSGNKLLVPSENGFEDVAIADPQFVVMQALGRSVKWLQSHHIKNKASLNSILSYFFISEISGGTSLEECNEYVKIIVKNVRKKIKEIDNRYNDVFVGLGQLANDVLTRWDFLWDEDISYELISTVIYCENRNKNIPILEAIGMIKRIELTAMSEFSDK